MPLVVGYADGVKLVLVVPENPLQMAQGRMTKLDRTLSGASRGWETDSDKYEWS